MNPSQQNNRGQINPASTAEQLLATADVENILTKMKSATADVSEFEIRRGSHPMPASDRSRHRPNNPNIDSEQQLGSSSTPVPLPSMAEGSELASDVVELPVPAGTARYFFRASSTIATFSCFKIAKRSHGFHRYAAIVNSSPSSSS